MSMYAFHESAKHFLLFIWDYEGGEKCKSQSQIYEGYAGRVAVNFVLFQVLSSHSKKERAFSSICRAFIG